MASVGNPTPTPLPSRNAHNVATRPFRMPRQAVPDGWEFVHCIVVRTDLHQLQEKSMIRRTREVEPPESSLQCWSFHDIAGVPSLDRSA